jgi:hypothetical protein
MNMGKEVEIHLETVNTASGEIVQHNNKWIDANKEFQTGTIISVFMPLHMRSLNAVRSKDMNQTKQIFVVILSLLILLHSILHNHFCVCIMRETPSN